MNKLSSIFLLTLTLVFTQCKTSQDQQASPTGTPQADQKKKYEYVTVPNDSLKARIYTLENGLTVYLSEYKDAPRIQTYVAVRAGSKNDPSDATGLAHYLEHMVFKGTSRLGTQDWEKEQVELAKIEALYEQYRQTRDEAQRKRIYHQIDSVSGVAAKFAIANEYDKVTTNLGAKGTNAYTWFEQTVYTNDIPSNQLEKWAMVEAKRFGEMVPRLFHTELEAVYEEKNRTLDTDSRKVFETLFANLFPTHQYGTQTTIGTIEHLKNPSITEIKKYFETYYVPNNMAIAMSGDLDPDKTIRIIDEHFGKLERKEVPAFNPAQEATITAPIVEEVYGPSAANVMIGFRFPGIKNREALVMRMIDRILSNGQAGLIDLNLRQKQAVLNASSSEIELADYSAQLLTGIPRQGQSLEQVKDLLLQQVELVKKGQFEDWLIPAIITDERLNQMRQYESNSARADAFVTAFIWGMDWKDYVAQLDQFASITKEEVMQVANKYLADNYVVVYKRTGPDPNAQKVEKPTITPVPVNRDSSSAFYKEVMQGEAEPIQPVFLNYEEDIDELKIKNDIPVYYLRNNENRLFNLYYVLETGTNNDPKLGLAVNYLKYLGTDKFSAEELQKEFYKLGMTFDVSSSQEQTYVTLSGLDDNFEQGLALFESLLHNPQPDQQALNDLVAGILKARTDAKLNKGTIHQVAMVNYAKYGPKNPFTNIIPEKNLKAMKPQELVSLIKTIPTYEHHILYYGPRESEPLISSLNTGHQVPAQLKPVPKLKEFAERDINDRVVYWADFDMVQAEILFLTKSLNFDKETLPVIALYNEYFGSGMGSIVFQEIRESKALAYSASSRYVTPSRANRANYILSYIGTQADKLPEAMDGMQALLNEMPSAEGSFLNAQQAIQNTIASERITKSAILMDYERAKRLGLDYDVRKDIYEAAQTLTLADIQKFQNQFIRGQNQAILVIGDKKRLDFKTLEKYGKVKQLNLQELFGY